MSHSQKKKRSSKKKRVSQKNLSIQYSTTDLSHTRSNSTEAESYLHHKPLPPMKPLSKTMKSRSANMAHENEFDSSDDDDMEEFNLRSNKNKKRTSSKKKRSSAKSHELKGVKSNYDRKLETMQLNRRISDQNITISNLKKEIKKYKKSEQQPDNKGSEEQFHRAIKNKEKEIANLRRRLKLAINDYEKVKF